MEDPTHQPTSDNGDRILRLIVEKNEQLKALLNGEGKSGDTQILQQLLSLSEEMSFFLLEKVITWKKAIQVTAEILSKGMSQEHYTPHQTCETDKPPAPWKYPISTDDAMHGFVEDLRSIESYFQCMTSKLNNAALEALHYERENFTSQDQKVNLTDGQVLVSPQSPQTDSELLHVTHEDLNSHVAPAPLNPHDASSSDGDQSLLSGEQHISFQNQLLQPEMTYKTKECCSSHNASDSRSFSSGEVEGSSVVEVETRPQPHETGEGGQFDRANMRGKKEVIPGGEGPDDCPNSTPRLEDRGGANKAVKQPQGDKRREGWVTLALSGRSSDGAVMIPNCCHVTAPVGVVQALACKVVDGISSWVVSGAEELISSVLRIWSPGHMRIPSPISIAIPFISRHRGSYRDVVVKVIDGDTQTSYISPTSTEAVNGGQRGSFAEVKVYKLGLFAVVSCLRKESFTVPRKGLSLKLCMDSRICFDYLPGTFSAPVVVQSMIQPVDGSFLSMLKSQSDMYQAVLSTSALVYLAHPSTVQFRRPLNVTLPCPPHPDRKRAGEEPEHGRPTSAVTAAARPAHRVRASSASVKSSREAGNEHLTLMGFKEDQWTVLEDVTVRNMKNGLVSFELTENLQRLVVIRLAYSVRPSHLIALIEEVEDSVHRSRVIIVLHHQKDEPQRAVVALIPSKDLSWELANLRKEGYCGPPDPSGEISMSEGEQLLLSFRGNITSSGRTNSGVVAETITFHSQRKNRLFLHLTEVDEFGNYSSPHYKATAIFHRVTKGQVTPAGDTPIISPDNSPQNPVCKLSLTLPKKARTVSRPVSAKMTSREQSDPLSDELLMWLAEELTEEDAALLVLCLRVRRSSIQLVKLKVPEHLPSQVFQLLAIWRRNQPTSTDKTSLLSHYLSKSGRPDLAKELLSQRSSFQ